MELQRTLGTKVRNGRRLGLLERWYVAHTRSGQHTGFLLSLELQGNPPDKARLKLMLRNVAARFPWLRARVRRDGVDGVDDRFELEKCQFVEEKDPLWGDDLYVQVQCDARKDYASIRHVVLDTSDTLQPGSADGLGRILEEEGKVEWHDEDPDALLWRVIFITWKTNPRKFAFVLAFHHLICDGVGACQVAQALLDASTLSPSESVTKNISTKLPPPMEDVVDCNPSVGHLLPVVLYSFPRLAPYLKRPHWRGNTVHSDNWRDRSSQMVCATLLQDGQRLRQTCKSLNLSINSVLVATLCKAIARIVNGPEQNSLRLKVQVAANERQRRTHAISPTELGSYVSGPQVYVQAGASDNVVRLSTTFRNRLESALQTSLMDMGLCKFINEDWIQFALSFHNETPNGIHDSVEYSNLGLVELDDTQSPWNVENIWFAQGRKGFGAAITVALAASAEGGISAVLSAFPQAVSRQMLLDIATEWERCIDKFL